MSFVAIGLFVLACGFSVYRQFMPTRVSATRDEGHPQYFGAALAAAYVAFLAIFLHTAALKVPLYAGAISTLVKLAPDSDKESSTEGKTTGSVNEPKLLVGQVNVEPGGVLRQLLSAPSAGFGLPKKDAPKPDPYATAIGIGLWSALLALSLASILNAPFTANGRLRELTLRKDLSEVEEALLSAYDRGLSVAVTLTSGKVYVGLPNKSNPNGDEPDWISLWPLASGYRTGQGRLRLTVAYEDTYNRISEADQDGLALDDFQVTLPLAHIVSIQNFSLRLYVEHFQGGGAEARESEEGQTAAGGGTEGKEETATKSSTEAAEVPEEKIIPSLSSPTEKQPAPVPWLKFLKWSFHAFMTATVVALPFSYLLCLIFLLFSLLALRLMADPRDDYLVSLLEAEPDIRGV